MQRKLCQFKPVSISLSPNTEKDDVWLAFKLVFKPWQWKRGKSAEELENEFKKYLGIRHAFAFNSGRSALLAILNSLGLNQGDEVLTQAYTCNAAVNPIRWAGLKLNYVDCDENDFNIDIEDLKRKITPQTKVIMVQHTFGLPADMDKILEIMRQNNLILIEDCAHSLGAEYSPPHQTRTSTKDAKSGASQSLLWCGGKGQKVGTFGKAAFFSFGRDKIISSVYGGMAVTNDDNLAAKMKEFQQKTKYPSCCWVFQQLLHPILMNWLIIPTYSILGKYLLVLFQCLGIMSKAVHYKEKRGEKPGYFPKKMPNVLALLAQNQIRKLERFNAHRQEIANFYYEELKNHSFELPKIYPERKNIFLRFTVKNPNAHQIIKNAWRKNILIGDWYTSPIAPPDTKMEKIGYTLGTCPKAEKLAETTFNLPTHINISKNEAQKVIQYLMNFSR